ncbi:RDD family protein, partial [Cellulomonas shaoxiangyii]|uniref:RDD family protein n=1 Tax=Cellulomonas shaoxiangyii TaxID=2566013 RepID=UPI0010945239
PSLARRALALAVDAGVAAVAAGAAGGAALIGGAPPLAAAATAALLVAVAQVVAEGVTGTTAGAVALGLRTVTHATGRVPGVGRAFVRQLVVGLGVPLLLAGAWLVAASATFDRGPHRRGWHDKASGTRVVDATVPPAGRAPEPPAAAPLDAVPRGSGLPALPLRGTALPGPALPGPVRPDPAHPGPAPVAAAQPG